MTFLAHDRYCDLIIEETARLRATVSGADLGAQVPSCPDWTLRELAVHTGAAHRWVHRIVSTRATEEVADEDVPHADGPATDDAAALDAWLAEGAALCAGALREAGPDAAVWAWAPTDRPALFWARRMTHETVVHRADAALAAKDSYEVEPEVAADALDEWLWLTGLDDSDEAMRVLHGEGNTLHLHATDTNPVLNAEWFVDFTATPVTWRRGHEKAAVAVRGPLTDLLLVSYRRRSPDAGQVEVLGDRALLDGWLAALAW
ncbi:maleylpyruvate isomerase family mycothiol-dependent enzyme [Streptomyces sp. NPDC051561]|uniref:maleylpyruvate isomerase family mycothiol-dependent enzyme n=1 Tax=Streptomyces sp. NPDC051561 TaxID=3365658 RepID=UPI00379F2F30